MIGKARYNPTVRRAPKPLMQYREERYLTTDEFAQLLGVSTRTLYRIVNGDRVRVTTMRRIAAKLDVHPAEIAEFARE
jgi:excisionase family DNA binding protein